MKTLCWFALLVFAAIIGYALHQRLDIKATLKLFWLYVSFETKAPLAPEHPKDVQQLEKREIN